MSSGLVTWRRGDSPLVLSMPHCGTQIPDDIARRLNETGRWVDDTDWWIDRLYEIADDLSPTIVRAHLSRYVIDVNRDPSGASLYPGQETTDLCPTMTFDGIPIYEPGEEPGPEEIERRRALYFEPYHAALRRAIEDARARHGYCLLYDCHSIRSAVPRLFEGMLPVFNIGTNGGMSCAPEVERAIATACGAADHWDHVVNGRFRGGWITRNYGQPPERVHAVQMELAQRVYMHEQRPWDYARRKAEKVQPVLRQVLEAMLGAGRKLSGGSE